MSRIHDLNFIHRDIRPDNILVSRDNVAKIGDMGIAKMLDPNNLRQTQIGCIQYMPPEFYSGSYTNKLDVYTFGLTLIELFGGSHNTSTDTNGERTLTVKKPKVFWEAISKCLNGNANLRPKSKEIEKTLTVVQKLFLKYVSKNQEYMTYSYQKRNAIFKLFFDYFCKSELWDNLWENLSESDRNSSSSTQASATSSSSSSIVPQVPTPPTADSQNNQKKEKPDKKDCCIL